MHPPIFLRGDDNAFIAPNIGRNCYAIAIKYSISGSGVASQKFWGGAKLHMLVPVVEVWRHRRKFCLNFLTLILSASPNRV